MSVDGVPRVVCGITEETTCQEVVIALAQALGMCLSCFLTIHTFKMYCMFCHVQANIHTDILQFRSAWTLHIAGEI